MQIVFHWPAVALAVLAGLFVHALAYSPFGLGPLWQRQQGLDEAQAKAGMLPRLGLSLVAVALQALCLAGFFNFTGSNSFPMGVLAALQLYLCLAAPLLALASVPARRPWGSLAVDLGVGLVVALLQGGLLASWQN